MSLLKPIVMPSAKQKVASELRKAILSRKLKEGEVLSLESIATQLNVSITPVREAFQILDRDGLIKLRQNKGAIVLGITDTYIRDHYQLRAILESSCAQLACENEADLSTLEDIMKDAQRMIETKEYAGYADNNRAFHSEIWHMSGNQKMENMVSELWNGLSMGNMVTEDEYAKISYKEQEQIYQALQKRDRQASYDAMYAHIMRSRDDMLTYYN